MTEAHTHTLVPGLNVSMTDSYYSAADLCGIIEEACRLALEEIRERNIKAAIPLRREMFEKAFKRSRPSISAEMLKQYEDFS